MMSEKIADYIKAQPSKNEIDNDLGELEELLSGYSQWIGCPKPMAIAWNLKAIRPGVNLGDSEFTASSGNEYAYSVFINGMNIPEFLSLSFIVPGEASGEAIGDLESNRECSESEVSSNMIRNANNLEHQYNKVNEYKSGIKQDPTWF